MKKITIHDIVYQERERYDYYHKRYLRTTGTPLVVRGVCDHWRKK